MVVRGALHNTAFTINTNCRSAFAVECEFSGIARVKIVPVLLTNYSIRIAIIVQQVS